MLLRGRFQGIQFHSTAARLRLLFRANFDECTLALREVLISAELRSLKMKRVKTARHAKTDSGCDNRSIVSLWVRNDGTMKNGEKRKGFRSALGIRTPARSLVDEEKGLASFCFFPFFADTTELG